MTEEDRSKWLRYYRLSISIEGGTMGITQAAQSLSHALEQELSYHMNRDEHKWPAQINISQEIA